MARHDDDELKSLLEQFVRVRAVQMGGVDLSVFQFDPLLSWSLFLMNADQTIYGRYGTAHPQTKRDKVDSNPNHSLSGLKAALRAALVIHRGYNADPEPWAKKLAGKTGTPPPWTNAENTPAARKYGRLGRVHGQDTHACVHCHEVQRTMIDSFFMTGKRVTDNMLWMYPGPADVGLSLSRDHSARITAVQAESWAAAAGLRIGDDILTAERQPLVSIADLSWVLHHYPDDGGDLALEVRRDSKTRTLELSLPPGWRRAGDFGWRYRVAGYAAWLWGGVTIEDRPDGVRVANRSPGWFKRPNQDARDKLQRGDVIVEVDGKSGWTRSRYLAYLMRDKELGSTVRLRVRRRGKLVDVAFTLPTERPEVLGY